MDTCPYPPPLTQAQQTELKIDCNFDQGLHPCCPGTNQIVSELGNPGDVFNSAKNGAFDFMADMNVGGLDGFGLLAAIVIGGLVGSFIRS